MRRFVFIALFLGGCAADIAPTSIADRSRRHRRQPPDMSVPPPAPPPKVPCDPKDCKEASAPRAARRPGFLMRNLTPRLKPRREDARAGLEPPTS